jgi:uncharacterized protein (TIGR00369 family)
MWGMADAIDTNLEAGIRQAFAKQGLMRTIGASLDILEAGRAVIRMPFSAQITQHNDFVHAGIITAIVDTACGCAAMSLSPTGIGLLSVEYKVNFLSPARGKEFIATGLVVKAGKTLTICQGTVEDDSGVQVALMQATMVVLKG